MPPFYRDSVFLLAAAGGPFFGAVRAVTTLIAPSSGLVSGPCRFWLSLSGCRSLKSYSSEDLCPAVCPSTVPCRDGGLIAPCRGSVIWIEQHIENVDLAVVCNQRRCPPTI